MLLSSFIVLSAVQSVCSLNLDIANRILSTAGAHSLFGIMGQIQHFDGTISVILIIAAVWGTEYIFESLHILTHDTPFQDMVFAIEKELMIVGCMAFIFKIIVNLTSIEPSWLLALEYSGNLK